MPPEVLNTRSLRRLETSSQDKTQGVFRWCVCASEHCKMGTEGGGCCDCEVLGARNVLVIQAHAALPA